MPVDRCECAAVEHEAKLVVLTGGPGAGKTAVLELVRRSFCVHVGILPEAAGIVFGGGFPRGSTPPARRVAQRAIFGIQLLLEELAQAERVVGIALCDRGTIDGLAYWPDSVESYWASVGTSLQDQLARYAAVIHLRTPPASEGYNRRNALRVESADEAMRLDERIARAWERHPRRVVIEHEREFLDKAARAVAAIRDELPACCRAHVVPEVDQRVRPMS